MHFTALAALALAFVGAAHAKPAPASSAEIGAPISHNVTLSESLPLIKLDSVQGLAAANTTLRLSGDPLENLSALQIFPATLVLCQSFGCRNCFGFDLRVLQQGVCLRTNFNFFSGGIVQPSDEGLPFGVFVGPPGCQAFEQITFTNACFDFPGPFTQVFIRP